MKRSPLAILTHGGAGAPNTWKDGCYTAAQEGYALLKEGRSSLEAAVASTRILEDDGRFNAGWGSALRLDAKTQEMDAAVMDTQGTLGLVLAISRVRNPVLVARAVSETPHVALAGSGAVRFARRRGFKSFSQVSTQAGERYEQLQRLIREERDQLPSKWRSFSLPGHWNFPLAYRQAFPSADTVGAVATSGEGNFAVALSTGGAGPMLAGRVGDTPFIGCGFLAGEHGAVAATGLGEEIIRRMAAKVVYDSIVCGMHPQRACEQGVSLFPQDVPVGFIALSSLGSGVASNRDMPTALMVQEE